MRALHRAAISIAGTTAAAYTFLSASEAAYTHNFLQAASDPWNLAGALVFTGAMVGGVYLRVLYDRVSDYKLIRKIKRDDEYYRGTILKLFYAAARPKEQIESDRTILEVAREFGLDTNKNKKQIRKEVAKKLDDMQHN